MQRLLLLLAAVAVMGLFGSGVALAQRAGPPAGGGGWGPGTPYARLFNRATVETIKGEVVTVDRIEPARGMSQGVHAVVQTREGPISVHLGPDWYVDRQGVKLAPKDRVEVTGSRVSFDGKPAIIATEVRKGGAVLQLRDANGLPAWSRRRR